MDDISLDGSCDCPKECNSISYSFSLMSSPLDPWKECPKRIQEKDFLMKEFYDTEVHGKYPPRYIRRLIQIKENISSYDGGEYCKKYLRYRAEVTFRLATNSLSAVVRSRRLSSYDQLSAFGK